MGRRLVLLVALALVGCSSSKTAAPATTLATTTSTVPPTTISQDALASSVAQFDSGVRAIQTQFEDDCVFPPDLTACTALDISGLHDGALDIEQPLVEQQPDAPPAMASLISKTIADADAVVDAANLETACSDDNCRHLQIAELDQASSQFVLDFDGWKPFGA